MLKGDMIKFTNLVFGKQQPAKSRLQALKSSKFSKVQYLVDLLGFCSTEEWSAKQSGEEQQNTSAHPKMTYSGTICVKAIKFLTNIIRRMPNDQEQDPKDFTVFLSTLEKLVAKYTCSGDTAANKNTHLTYLALKLLNTLLKTYPKAAADLSTQLLQDLGSQLKTFKTAAHHKHMFAIAAKLADHL
jgi:hypothetical protein